MNVMRFVGRSSREAMARVRATFGDDAVVLSNRACEEGIEIVAMAADDVGSAPQADLNLFGLVPDPNFDFVRTMVRATHATCLFVRDSGHESALA